MAYYYAAILNYLAYTVLRSGRTFNRDQYARPLLAIYIAGLSWNNMDEETRGRIVELSKKLHEKAPGKEYSNQRIALQEVAGLPEFKELVKIVDSKVDRSKLEEALSGIRFQYWEGQKRTRKIDVNTVMLTVGFLHVTISSTRHRTKHYKA